MAPSVIALTEQSLPAELQPHKTFKDTSANGVISAIKHGCTASDLVAETLKRRIESIDHETCEPGEEDAFFVADVGEVYRQHLRWKLNLKRVKPFYAVKCNPDPRVLQLLAELGTGFDCASKQEIQQVLDMGVDPARIIYAQPCKTNSFIRYAAQQGVKQMTFDNAEELFKIKRHFPTAELFLRISTDDSSSLCRLSLKFGAALSDTAELLALAKSLALDVVGVSFHVGSGATDPNLFVKAIHDARVVFDEAAHAGFNLRTLDIGGGFSSETFERMAAAIGPALDACFPPHIRIIGEPGRYYVARAFQLACAVIARRTMVAGPDAGLDAGAAASYMLYLNDGVYGNFSSIMYDHQQPVPKILRCGSSFLHGREPPPESGDSADGLTHYSIWGPTCDGIDCITPSCTLPAVLNVGDWLYFENMGAYTMCSATRFNGFTNAHDVYYVSSEPGATALLEMKSTCK